MALERRLYALAIGMIVLGALLVMSSGSTLATTTHYCDKNATQPCSCIQTGANTVCFDMNQAAIPTWCSANGQKACVAARTIQCPGNGTVGNGTCAMGWVHTRTPCNNTAVPSCN